MVIEIGYAHKNSFLLISYKYSAWVIQMQIKTYVHSNHISNKKDHTKYLDNGCSVEILLATLRTDGNISIAHSSSS